MGSPSGPNPHGRFLWSCPITVSAFILRSHNNWGAGLPKPDSGPAPDSLGIGLSWAISQNTPKSTRSCTLGQSVHYWTLSRCPSRLLGRRTAGVGIGVNTHHRALISDRMAGWPPHRVSEYQIDPRKSYISQQKYTYLITRNSLH